MRIVYANAYYPLNDTRGKSAKIRQIVDTSLALGHELILWKKGGHPNAPRLPENRLSRLLTIRHTDAIMILIEATPHHTCRYGLFPYRQYFNNPVMVWEFNSIPEFLGVIGKSDKDIQSSIRGFRHYASGCDLAICVSQAIADYVQKNLGIRRTAVIPNGSDPEMFRPDIPPVRRVRRSEDHLNVVWIGSAELAWHNFELMRQAAELLWQQGEGARISFHLIGQKFQQMRDMPANIHYYGSDDYSAIPNWLAAMDVGLCLYHPGPADYNSPLKLFDYMASGLAVVATEQPQVRHVFEQLGQAEFLVNPKDPVALASILKQLAEDRERVARLGKAGRQLVIDEYNWRRVVADTIQAIDNVIADKQKLRLRGKSYVVSRPK